MSSLFFTCPTTRPSRSLSAKVRAPARHGVLHSFGSTQVKSRGVTDEHYRPLSENRTRML
jgi:hypothetical protein